MGLRKDPFHEGGMGIFSHYNGGTPTVSHVDQRSVAHVKQTQGRKVLPVGGYEVRGLAKVLACWSG